MEDASDQEATAPANGAARAHDEVLSYLLKHAHVALQQLSDDALSSLDITSRDLGVLRVIATGEATSQQEVATVLGVDRTSMVTLIDTLEAKELVRRQPSEQDRRRNVLALTHEGHELYQQAERTSTATERAFLHSLGETEARNFTRSLHTLLDATQRSAEPRQRT